MKWSALWTVWCQAGPTGATAASPADWVRTLQQIPDADPVLFQCWPNVVDVGPALKQHWFVASWLQDDSATNIFPILGCGTLYVRFWF